MSEGNGKPQVQRDVRVDTIYAFLSVDPETNSEGIVAYRSPTLGNMPLIAANRERLEQFREWAEAAVEATGHPIVLARFDWRQDVETLEP